MKIVVMGGTGLIGSNVVHNLGGRAMKQSQRHRIQESTPSPGPDLPESSRGRRSLST